MKRVIIITGLFILSFGLVSIDLMAQNITGDNTPDLGGTYTYTYDPPSQYFMPTWTVSNGTVQSTHSSGSLYWVIVKWDQGEGSGSVVFKNGRTTIKSLGVTVSSALTAGSIGGTKTICHNASAGTMTNSAGAGGCAGGCNYLWQKSTNGSSWTTASGSNTGATYSPGNLTATTWFRRRVSDDFFTKYTNSVKVTVKNLGAGSISTASKNFCYNSTPGLINASAATNNVGTRTYTWQKSTNNSTWVNVPSSNTEDYTPPALTATTWYRRRVVDNCATKYTNSVKFTVKNLNPGSIGNAQTLCYNGNPSALSNTGSASGNNGTVNYQWQISSNGSSGWTNISGATGTTYDPGSLTSNKWYRRRAIDGCFTKYTNTIKITVTNLNAGSINGLQTICYNGDPSTLGNSSSASNAKGSVSYQWQYSNNGSSGWTNISGATGTTYNPPSGLTVNRWYRRRAIDQCATKYSNTIPVTVRNLTAGSIGGTQTICHSGDPGTLSNSSSAGNSIGSVSYQWQYSNNGSSGWSNINGATGTTYNPPSGLTVNRWYRRRVIDNCFTKYTNSIKVTVKNLSAGSINNAQTICYNGDPGTIGNSSSASNNKGTISYQWQYSTNGSSGWTNISGATGTTYNPPNGLTVNRWYRRRAIDGCFTKYTNSIKITVKNLSAGSINGAQTVCYGGDPTTFGNSSSASNNKGTIHYQWQFSTNGSSGWTNINGATSSTYNAPSGISSNRWYRRRAQDDCTTKYTGTVKVTVKNLSAGSIGGTQTVCYNGDPGNLTNSSSASNNNGTVFYQWQYSNNGSSGWTNISGATGTTYNPPSGLTVNRWYRRRAIDGCFTKYSNSIKVTVKNLSAGSINGTQTICHAGDPSTLGNTGSAANNHGTLTYQWQYSANGSSGWTNIAGANGSTYNPPSGLTVNRWYRRRATDNCFNKYTAAVKVTVKNLTSGSISTASKNVCHNTAPGAIAASASTNNLGTLSYQWEWSSNGSSWSSVSGATGEDYTPPTLASTRHFRRKATDNCQTEYTNTVTFWVKNLNAGSIGGTQTICNNGDPSTLSNGSSASSNNGTVQYQWQYSANGSSGWTNISSATGTTYNPPSGLTVDRWYRRRAIDNCFTRYTNSVKVTVKNLSAGSISGAQTICHGANPSVISNAASASNGNGTISYQWEHSSNGTNFTNISGATSATYDPPSLTASKWYRRKAIDNCFTRITSNVKITVKNLSAGSISTSNQSICNGTSPGTISASASSNNLGTMSYQWQSSSDGSNWSNISGATSEDYNPGTMTSTKHFRRLTTDNCKTVNTNTVAIIVYNLQAGSITGNQDVCYNTDASILGSSAAASGGSGSYTYTWFESNNNSTWVAIPSTNSASYDPTTNLTTDKWYKRRVTDNTCGNYKETGSVHATVYNQFNAGDVGSSSMNNGDVLNYCYNENPAVIGNLQSPSGSGSFSYQWEYSTDRSAWFALSGQTSSTFDPISSTTEQWYRRKVTDNVCGNTGYSDEFFINFYDEVNAGALQSGSTVCIGETPPNIVGFAATGGDGVFSYQWEYADLGTTNWNIISGGNGVNYNPPVIPSSRKYRRKVMDNCAVDLYTNEVVVTVYDPLSPGTIVGTTTTADDPFTIASSVPADGGSGSLVYSWEFSHDNQGWNPMPGTSASLYDSGFHTNVWIRRVVTDNGCGTTDYTPSVILQIGAKPTFEGFVTGGKVHRTSTNTTTLTLSGYLGTISEWQSSRYGYEWTGINNTTATLTVNNLDETTYYRAKLEYQGYTSYSEVSEIHILSDEPGDVTPVNITDNKFTQSVVVKPITSMDDYLTLNDTTEVWKTISYTDGLGRAVMSYEHLVTPNATHQVGFQTYDTTGRSNRSYMPFVTNSVLNYENLVSSQSAYYQSGAITDPSNFAFAEVIYENSPAGIVLESGSVGEDWQLGNGHTVKSEIGFNRPGETVHKWTYDGTTLAKNGTYGTSMLSRIASTDENGNRVASYTDTHGKNVLKKVYLDNDSLETYYVYDDFERLVAVVPPEAVVEFTSSSQDFIDKWIFTYTYDSRGRLIEKKVPGTGPEYVVYSDLGEVVLTQDAQLRMNDQWAFAKADGRGRALYGGLYTNSSDSRAALQEHLDSLDHGYETRTSDSLGYTNTIFPTSNITITSVSYYDDYDLDNDGAVDESIDHSLGALSKTDHQLTGMMTASKSRVIGTDDWLIAYYFYDSDGQSIQVKSQNHLVPDSMDVSSNFYLADGTLDYAIDKTHLPNGLTVKNKYRYDYDHRDRVTAIYHTINDGTEQELASYVYDDMGRLVNKKLHKQGNDYLEQVDYAFTLQGRLKSINDPDQDGKAFAMEFFYNENLGGLSQTKQYNGNISAISWKSGTDDNTKAYAYSYDASDRLVGAKYGTGVAFAQNTGRYDVSNLAYDKNGNISSVRRKSWNDTITYDLDDLNMVYAGNQLKQVTDAGQAGGFTDGANTANEYDYNVAGSLTKDLNKGMDSILYNYLGQVDSIIFADSSALKYIYDGGGIKLAALEYRKDTLYQRKDYVGSMVLEDNVLKEYSIPEGRVVWNSNNDQERQYKLTDHQGNVRAVVSTLPKNVTFLATMEEANESIEEPIFGDMDGYRVNQWNLDPGGKVAGLNINHPIGPRLMLNVAKGDTVNISVRAYHEIVNETSQGFDPTIFASLISNSFSTVGGSENAGSVLTNAIEDAALALGLNGNNSSTEAQGYLNWVMLDNDLSLIASNTGFIQANDTLLETGNLIMEKAGYLLVYVSNERQGLQRVYFDDLEATLKTGNLEQVHEYYPFGQETAGSWHRPGSRINAFSYNAGSEYSLATKWLETYYRPYDPALGRFTGVDVLADNFSSLTPYQYGFNDPVYYNDPVGDSPFSSWDEVYDFAVQKLHSIGDGEGATWYDGTGWGSSLSYDEAVNYGLYYNNYHNTGFGATEVTWSGGYTVRNALGGRIKKKSIAHGVGIGANGFKLEDVTDPVIPGCSKCSGVLLDEVVITGSTYESNDDILLDLLPGSDATTDNYRYHERPLTGWEKLVLGVHNGNRKAIEKMNSIDQSLTFKIIFERNHQRSGGRFFTFGMTIVSAPLGFLGGGATYSSYLSQPLIRGSAVAVDLTNPVSINLATRGGTHTIYRVASPGEAADVMSMGFRQAPISSKISSYEGKLFWSNLDDATWYQNWAGKENPILKIRVKNSFIYENGADVGREFYFVSPNRLGQFNSSILSIK